jgi:hypothetical protein
MTPHVQQIKEPVFTSSREVVAYYTSLIDELTPQLQEDTFNDSQSQRLEIAHLRRQFVKDLENFAPNRVDEYFNEKMANAESDQEYFQLSNAYETILLAELANIKKKLHTLRTA